MEENDSGKGDDEAVMIADVGFLISALVNEYLKICFWPEAERNIDLWKLNFRISDNGRLIEAMPRSKIRHPKYR